MKLKLRLFRTRALAGWGVAVVALTMSGSSLAHAQTVDPQLQGRLLQGSDGTLFVYKDGLKYPVQVLEVDDDVINSIPDADTPIAQLDQLFVVLQQAAPPQPPPPPAAAEAPAPVVLGPPAPLSVPGPYIAVANPTPGDTLAVGGLEMQGKAFDPSAPVDQGAGVDRVQVFLEDRDRGGLHLGDARLGIPNAAAAPGSQFSLAGWDIIVNLPGGAHTLFVYAHSGVTSKESSVQVPVKVGTGP
jgi:hypothetical protein